MTWVQGLALFGFFIIMLFLVAVFDTFWVALALAAVAVPVLIYEWWKRRNE